MLNVFVYAYSRAHSGEIAVSGFHDTGIYPVHSNGFKDHDLLDIDTDKDNGISNSGNFVPEPKPSSSNLLLIK